VCVTLSAWPASTQRQRTAAMRVTAAGRYRFHQTGRYTLVWSMTCGVRMQSRVAVADDLCCSTACTRWIVCGLSCTAWMLCQARSCTPAGRSCDCVFKHLAACTCVAHVVPVHDDRWRPQYIANVVSVLLLTLWSSHTPMLLLGFAIMLRTRTLDGSQAALAHSVTGHSQYRCAGSHHRTQVSCKVVNISQCKACNRRARVLHSTLVAAVAVFESRHTCQVQARPCDGENGQWFVASPRKLLQ
jgi:hypothetical protein